MSIKNWWNKRKEKKLKKEEEKRREEIKRDIKRVTTDVLNFDFGASKVKYFLKGKEGEFRSSIRVIDNIDKITTQPNYLKINGVWYAIGENQVSPSSQLRKADKENFEMFLIYCLVKENTDNGNYDVNMLLPSTQFDDKYKIAKKINRQFDVITADGRKYKYDLFLNGIFAEGEMSDYYIRQMFPQDKGNRAIGNMGYSTFDVAAFLMTGEQMPTKSYPVGMNKILVEHNQVILADNASVLSLWRSQGYKYTEEQLKATRAIEKDKINNLMNDVYAGSLSTLTPNATTLYICGGGSVAIEHSIKEYIKDNKLLTGYKVVVLEGKDALYTDLYGMVLYTNNKLQTIKVKDKIKNDEVATDNYKNEEVIEQTKEDTKINITDKEEENINSKDNSNLTDKEIEVIETYLKNKGTKGHTQKHYGDMLNITERQFKYLLDKYKEAHSKENEPTHNNIIPLTGGR